MGKLRERMRGVPPSEVSRVIEHFEEYWMDALESGKTEAEIAAELDTPEQIAAQVRANLAFVSIEENPGFMSFGKVLGVVLLALFAIPVAFPLVIVVFALAVSVFAILFSLVVIVFALVISGVALIIAGASAVFTGEPMLGLGILGCGLVMTGLMLLCGVGVTAAVRATIAACGRFFRWLYRKITRKQITDNR
jgi:uncharacterized membrane protein